MLLNHRRSSVCATTHADVKTLAKVLRTFEREALVRIAMHHMAAVVPAKSICDALEVSPKTYNRTLACLRDKINDELREVK